MNPNADIKPPKDIDFQVEAPPYVPSESISRDMI